MFRVDEGKYDVESNCHLQDACDKQQRTNLPQAP